MGYRIPAQCNSGKSLESSDIVHPSGVVHPFFNWDGINMTWWRAPGVTQTVDATLPQISKGYIWTIAPAELPAYLHS